MIIAEPPTKCGRFFNYPQMSIMGMHAQLFFVTCNKNENHTL